MISYIKLLNHQWLEFRRSTFWQKSLVINIVISILLLYLALNLVGLGWFLDAILKEAFPEQDIVFKLTELLFYYFAIDLLGRFVLQDIPVLTIAPYLHLPVKRQKLLDYLLFRSVFSFFNLIPLLIITPFFVKVVGTRLGGSAYIWYFGILCIVLANNYITVFLKNIFGVKPLISLVALVLIGLLAYLDISGYLMISDSFSRGYFILVANPVLLVIPIVLVTGSYFIDRSLLSTLLYKETQSNIQKGKLFSDSFSFLSRFGVTGALIMLEIRLIFRNARPRTLAIMSTLFLLYGFMMYRVEMETNYGFLLFPAFFLTGLFMYSHGQLILSWDSSHFDFFLVQNLSTMDILLSKYRLFLGVNTLFFILTLPYGLFDSNIYFVNTCMYLFNSGFTVFILLLVGVNSTKRVDLTKSAFMNYEGFSAITYLAIIPAFGLPFLLYWPFSALGYPIAGIGFVGFIGMVGIAMHKSVIIKLSEIMTRRKYKMSSGYRNG